MTDESPKTPDAADMPTQDNAQPAGEAQKGTGYTMNAVEILDRYHIAQATLNGAPMLVVLGQVISTLAKGAAGPEGADLGRQLSIVTANFANLQRQKIKPSIIMPGNAPGVPNGLGGKPRQ